jgi:hypothetical protein
MLQLPLLALEHVLDAVGALVELGDAQRALNLTRAWCCQCEASGRGLYRRSTVARSGKSCGSGSPS